MNANETLLGCGNQADKVGYGTAELTPDVTPTAEIDTERLTLAVRRWTLAGEIVLTSYSVIFLPLAILMLIGHPLTQPAWVRGTVVAAMVLFVLTFAIIVERRCRLLAVLGMCQQCAS